MPVTLTVNQLALDTRVIADVGAHIAEPWEARLLQGLAAAKAFVEDYAPDAPDANLNEAVTLMVGYKIEAPHYTRTMQNAFVHSGAQFELHRWHNITSALVI